VGPAPAERARPERRVEHALNDAERARAGDVLEEAQLTTGSQHARNLGQGALRNLDAAEDTGHDGGIHGRIRGGEVFPVGVDDPDRNRRALSCVPRQSPKVRFRFHGDELGHRRRVVAEAHPRTGPDLDHAPSESGQQPPTVLRPTLALFDGRSASLDPGEERTIHALPSIFPTLLLVFRWLAH
jgi:hypothetical protein